MAFTRTYFALLSAVVVIQKVERSVATEDRQRSNAGKLNSNSATMYSSCHFFDQAWIAFN
jgi:uncharacterized membrane protein YidH (DUF202 family)